MLREPRQAVDVPPSGTPAAFPHVDVRAPAPAGAEQDVARVALLACLLIGVLVATFVVAARPALPLAGVPVHAHAG